MTTENIFLLKGLNLNWKYVVSSDLIISLFVDVDMEYFSDI